MARRWRDPNRLRARVLGVFRKGKKAAGVRGFIWGRIRAEGGKDLRLNRQKFVGIPFGSGGVRVQVSNYRREMTCGVHASAAVGEEAG